MMEEVAEAPVEETSVQEVTASKRIEDSDSGEEVNREATVHFDPGESAEEAIAKFGDECVYDFFFRAVKVKLQAVIRSYIELGYSEEQIQKELSDWRPDVDRTPSRDPVQAILSNFNKLEDEDRDELVEKLKARLAQMKGE